MSTQTLSHLAADGTARMVDVSAKTPLVREAIAVGSIVLKPETIALVKADGIAKGNVLSVARVAGIQAMKSTAALIPLCHTLPIDEAAIDFAWIETGLEIRSRVKTTAKTGVEMEALTGVSVAALTIYDMCKAVDKEMQIDGIRLLSKTKKPL